MQIFLILFCFGCFAQVLGKSINHFRHVNEHLCGYQSCHKIKEGFVNVHLIPHSHDDVGWVKTVDQFYYGTNSDVYDAGVAFIYDSVLPAVQKNKDRRFIYVETAFFWKWWQEKSEVEQNMLRKLVDNGQIEFIGGGWSMNDEAVTNYQSIIDQMTWGLRKLNDTFGECGRPKMGWQIDPFGHSNEMASIFAQLGYDGVILGRIDYQDKTNRIENKSMEMVWRGSENAGRKSDIFTSVLYNHYDAPKDFCFDVLCNDGNLVDDPSSPEYNIEQRATQFIAYLKEAKTSFQTSNIIVPMGRDFAYQQADRWYSNMDKLIKYINGIKTPDGTKYNLIYSTPSCYAAAVQKETAGVLTSPLKTDDFMPYASEPKAFWTGYYTSRPTLKRFERIGNNFLQICKQLYAISNLSSTNEPKLDSLRQAMGILQHHDAITGTEKEVVAYDYARLLHMGISDCENVTSKALSSLIKADDIVEFNSCLLTNVSQCALTEESERFLVTVYNPLSHPIDKYVRLPVTRTSYRVLGPDGELVSAELFPILSAVTKIPGRNSQATTELVFKASQVPPLGFVSYYVQRVEGNDLIQENLEMTFKYSNSKGVGFTINPSTGLLASIERNDISLSVDQRFWFYNGSNGFSDFEFRSSGAYLFRPDEDNPIAKISDTATFEVYSGNIVTEVHQTFNKYVKQIIKVYENEEYLEFDWIVGPIDMFDSINGKEIISRFTTDLNTNATFYTDSNGRDMMRRIRNYRPTWNLMVNETISCNYYPVTSRITLKDEDRNLEFAVLTDRAEGGSSLEDGEIELMLLRNTITDDQLGVGESLQELAFDEGIVARGAHYVAWGHINKTSEAEETIASIQHEIVTQKLLDSWVFLSVPTAANFAEYAKSHVMKFSGLVKALPKNVHIMTLEPWTTDNTYLIRLEHVFEKNEDPILSSPVTVNLTDLFSTFLVKSIKETTLGGNQWLEDNQRLNFKSLYQLDDLDFQMLKHSGGYLESTSITLEPMEIRTFIIEVTINS
ncbi:lysosomal alpha-mannosidase-like isoform X2 [Anthonomus grandis grandis]|uniref:lysosomal alpha-mannosidase-like isoform X2 n=1 Tax=Anthonomus grandis grandis TaxID=2921223 RepID=UPI0021654EDF|nr:lysosomal alpha-mannosidase-like isoform X2 [Anthonomus grandis grandis]